MTHRRIQSQKTPLTRQKSANKSHIVQENLNKKGQLIDKYQTQIQDLLEKINDSQTNQKTRSISNTISLKPVRNRGVSSKPPQGLPMKEYHTAKDYQGLILGLQYALQNQKKRYETTQSQNRSLQLQISNLRNLLVGPDQSKGYEMKMIEEAQGKINSLQSRIIQQKKNYEFIIQSKNEAIINLEAQLKNLKIQFDSYKDTNKEITKEKSIEQGRKFLQIFNKSEEMRNALIKKNIQIQRLKYQKIDDSDSEDDQIKKIRNQDKIKFYLQQLQISNTLIIRKNIQILNLSNKIIQDEHIIDVIEQFLDKKQVKNISLAILEQPCVNKLRILLREKAVFQRELLLQLSEHNKKILHFESQVQSRQGSSAAKLSEVINDNRRLASLVSNLQINITNLERIKDDISRDNQILRTQVQIQKKKFIEEVQNLKHQLGNISSVTKNEFDRMKIENLKLSEQNRSLLFLVGQKQRQIHNKGQSIKVFEQYKEKINSLNIEGSEKRKIQSVAQQPQIGTKVMMIDNFSNWMFQWNKYKNWNNKKTLLNLILDKEQIRNDSLNSISYLINVIHQCILQSKNLQIQERATILLSYYLQHHILRNPNLYVNKIAPVIIRCFRGIIQEQSQIQVKMLNLAALKITNQMQKLQMKWSLEMTNEMLAVNGLKYLFKILTNSQIDDEVEMAYNTLTMIAKAKQMISFMISFNVSEILLSKMNTQYPFIIFALHFTKALLMCEDYIRAQKSLLEYRKIFQLLKIDDDEQLIQLSCDCLLSLMENTLFTQSLNKILCISIIAQTISTQNNYNILKKCGKIYIELAQNLQTQSIIKFTRVEIEKMLQVVKAKRFNQTRFNRCLRIVRQIAQIFTEPEIDQKIISCFLTLYVDYESINAPTRVKLNGTINVIFERNKEVISQYSSEQIINNLVQAYKLSSNNDQIIFLLKILYFLSEQRKSTEIIRAGRESLINRILSDALASDYNIAIGSLKNLLMLSKQKYIQKFFTKSMMEKIIGKIINERGEEEHLSLILTCLYYLSKNQDLSGLMIDSGLVGKIFNVIIQRHQKQQIIMKCFVLLQLCNANHYKKRILNYLLASDPSLQILKTINFILRKSKDKINLASKAVFIYQYLNSKAAIQSITILVQRNEWMVEDLVKLRNDYVNKLDALVYKVQLLLHQMSKISNKVNKYYQKFKIQGQESQQDG